MINLINSTTAFNKFPKILKGILNSHKKGNKTTARRANGQLMANRMNHRKIVRINLIEE